MGQFGRSTPLKPIYTRGSVAPALKITSQTDNFDDSIIDPVNWPGNYGATFETGGFAVTGCDTAFNGFQTGNKFTILNDECVISLFTPTRGGATTQAFAELNILSDQQASNTSLTIQCDAVNGVVWAFDVIAGADVGVPTSTPMTSGTLLWLRIKESAGTLTWATSPTGNPSSWTTLRTEATPAWITTSTLKVIFQSHRSDGTNDFVSWDNFNLPTADPATPSPVWRPAPWRRIPGQVVFMPKGFHPGESSPQPVVVSPFSGRKPFPLPPGARYSRAPEVRVPPSAITAVGLDGALQVPLAVRITTDATDIQLIAEVKDLTMRSTVGEGGGGFASATVTIDRPLDIAVPEVKQFGRMYVYDTCTGETAWEGRLEDPGRSAAAEGSLWNITATGPSAHAKDVTFAYVPIGTSLSDWEKFGGSVNSATVSSSTDANDVDGLKVQFAGGIAVATPVYVAGRLLTLLNAGTSLASISATGTGGGTGQWEERVYAYGPSGAELIDSNPLSTSPLSYRGVVGTDFSAGQTTPHLRMDRTGASAAPDDNAYTFYSNIVVRSVLVDEEGNAVTSYANDYVTTTQLVQDLVGAHTTEYDGLDAFIADIADQITNFWYPDGTTVFDALNDLIALQGAYYWAAWETIPRSGKWRFEFRAWPTTVRYEAGIEDGFESPGSATDLYNEVSVHWVDAKGRNRTTVRTLSCPTLTAAGLTRSKRIDLGDQIGSDTAANSAGDAFLLEHNLPSQSGRLVIARKILDFDRGMLVDPWMIRPGGLIRVRGVDAKPNALNPTGRDGNTIFRIASTEYRASDNSVQLELDTDSLSTSRALASLKQATGSTRRHRNH